MASDTPRYEWIDISKGIGIILVIIGHCMFPCHAIIDSFHMPLFFILAGITFKTKPSGQFIIDKINRIMIPFIFWSIISALLGALPHNYTGPYNGPLWFLSAIFTALIITYLLQFVKLGGVRILILIAFTAISYIFATHSSLLPDLPFSLRIALMSSVFICIGIRLAPLKTSLENSRHRITFSLLSGLSFIILFGFTYTRYSISGPYCTLQIFRHGFLLILLCAITGSIATIAFSKLIARNKWLSWLGRNSLVLMCVHFPFAQSFNVICSQTSLYQTTGGRIILALVEYIAVFSISIAITLICKKYIPTLNGYKPMISIAKNA